MAHDLEPPPAAPNPIDTPAPVEPAYLARARRILAGDVREGDYLPVPDTVRAQVKQYLATLPFEATESGERELLFDWVFHYHYANDVVLARTTERGVLVLAVGLDQIGPVLERFVIDHHTGFVYICPFTD